MRVNYKIHIMLNPFEISSKTPFYGNFIEVSTTKKITRRPERQAKVPDCFIKSYQLVVLRIVLILFTSCVRYICGKKGSIQKWKSLSLMNNFLSVPVHDTSFFATILNAKKKHPRWYQWFLQYYAIIRIFSSDFFSFFFRLLRKFRNELSEKRIVHRRDEIRRLSFTFHVALLSSIAINYIYYRYILKFSFRSIPERSVSN